MDVDKAYTLSVDPNFRIDVIAIAEILIDEGNHNNRYDTFDGAVEDILLILMELWFMDEANGYDMLVDYICETEGGLEYETAIHTLAALATCDPKEYPDTGESIEVLRHVFEYDHATPDLLPISHCSFTSSGNYVVLVVRARR